MIVPLVTANIGVIAVHTASGINAASSAINKSTVNPLIPLPSNPVGKQ